MNSNEENIVEVINGFVELSDNKGAYLRRITDNTTTAHINGFHIVVLKQNGDVMLYDDLGNYYRTLCRDVSDATFIENGVLITKHNGEAVIADVNGLCIRV